MRPFRTIAAVPLTSLSIGLLLFGAVACGGDDGSPSADSGASGSAGADAGSAGGNAGRDSTSDDDAQAAAGSGEEAGSGGSGEEAGSGGGGEEAGSGGTAGPTAGAGGSDEAGAGGTACETEGLLSFEPVPVPMTDEQKRSVNASSWMELSCEQTEIGFKTILRSGDSVDGAIFGQVLDHDGQPVLAADGSDFVSNDNDFTSLLPVGDKLFSITHFESRPGGAYLTELEQDSTTGELTAVSTSSIDFSAYEGLWVPCAGSVTPWQTHLGSEEYPPDARTIEAATAMVDLGDSDGPYWAAMVRYWGLDPDTVTIEEFRANLDPYQYGYPVEITVTEAGESTVVKHRAMGRAAIELAYVMPDEQTAYITDDGTNVGFYMFVADAPGDLTAGTLYAAKWVQTSAEDGGSAVAEWVDLGHATNADVDDAIASGVTFSDLFETAAPDETDATCPDTFTSIHTERGQECLKVVAGAEMLASRLETRRYAAMLGGTTEFRKEEGVTFDPDGMKLYVAMSEVRYGMEDDSSNDVGGPNDIQLEANKCGAVYEMDVAADSEIGSDYVAQGWTALVVGTQVTDDPLNTCDLDGIANPDNVTFIPGYDTLIIGEDTGNGHQNDAVWSYNRTAGELTRIETTPYGSETTSPYFYPNIGGFAYLMSVVQHPYGESDQDQMDDASQAAAYVGYIGPMPALD